MATMAGRDDLWDDDEDGGDGWHGGGRAPICPTCGVTMLPSELSNVVDGGFECANEGCDAYGEAG